MPTYEINLEFSQEELIAYRILTCKLNAAAYDQFLLPEGTFKSVISKLDESFRPHAGQAEKGMLLNIIFDGKNLVSNKPNEHKEEQMSADKKKITGKARA